MRKLPITAVVCTLNDVKNINHVIKSLLDSGVLEIIVVDGGSSDGTLQSISHFPIIVLQDKGQGLGPARKMGIASATQEYILNCGSDNLMNFSTLEKMFSELNLRHNLAGVGCRTSIDSRNCFEKLLKFKLENSIKGGFRPVLGTPSLFRTATLRRFQFSESRAWSDDEELCKRIKRELGLDFYIVDSFCREIGKSSFKSFIFRMRCYGKSDYEVFSANKNLWSFRRKIRSLFHPIESELIKPIIGSNLYESVVMFPLLILGTLIRYFSWISTSILEKHPRLPDDK
jgi:glycosyltransferase involved in cell wall biosynthesis